jgi:hypothetical protein
MEPDVRHAVGVDAGSVGQSLLEFKNSLPQAERKPARATKKPRRVRS